MQALEKIKKAGFSLSVNGRGNIEITPFNLLTQSQITFLKIHKAEIIAELEQGRVEWVEIPPPLNDGLTVVCYTPAGNPVSVQSRDAGHAAWLLKMNTQPMANSEVTQ